MTNELDIERKIERVILSILLNAIAGTCASIAYMLCLTPFRKVYKKILPTIIVLFNYDLTVGYLKILHVEMQPNAWWVELPILGDHDKFFINIYPSSSLVLNTE